MRWLAAILGIVGVLGTVHIALVCLSVGSLVLDPTESTHPALVGVVRVGSLLLASAGAALVLIIGMLPARLPRRAISILTGVGIAAMVWLGSVFWIITGFSR